MKTLFLICCMAVLCLAGCYEYHVLPIGYVLDKYKGQSEHEILLEFGPPEKTISDGAGGKILDYRKSSDPTTVTGLYEDYEHHLYTVAKTQTVQWYLQFYINPDNKVYNYRSNIPGPVTRTRLSGPQAGAPPSPFKVFSKRTDTVKKS